MISVQDGCRRTRGRSMERSWMVRDWRMDTVRRRVWRSM